jgi:hypothetical protein
MSKIDPFQKFTWQPFDAVLESGGTFDDATAAVEISEAPLGIFLPDPELASAVAQTHGIKPGHLRFTILTDAMPAVAPREEGEMPGMHFNAIGTRQIPLYKASLPEQAVITGLMTGLAEHLEEVFNPEDGIAIAAFGNQVPTVHGHVIPRLKKGDGVDYWTNRSVEAPVPLELRQQMRDQAALGVTQVRILQQAVVQTLERFT